MKTKTKELLKARAVTALENLYHNATPRYPRCQNDAESDVFQSWFDDIACFEIHELNSGGTYGGSIPKFENLKSERAREYAKQKYHNEKTYDQARGARYELIAEYGKLYQYGRGGRTLAPEDLIKTRGGGSFSIQVDFAEDMNAENLTDLILTVEAFNQYVENWNNSVSEMWIDYKNDNELNFDQYNDKMRHEKITIEYI